MWNGNKYFPPDNDVPEPPERVWRYMDIWKLLSMLRSSDMYFTRLGVLCKDDPCEGAPSKAFPAGDGGREAQEYLTSKKRAYHFVSCWHLNEDESMFMWRHYGGPSHGVAVQSTVQRLYECLKHDARISIHRVEYQDFCTVQPDYLPSLVHLGGITKRKSFNAEREVRAILTAKSSGDGVPVRVDLGALIETIHLAPQAADWQEKLLRELTAGCGASAPVIHSGWEDLR